MGEGKQELVNHQKAQKAFKQQCARPKTVRSGCVVHCEADVKVKLNAEPQAQCKVLNRRGTEFDVALDINVNPRCELRHKKTIREGCTHRCIFGVKLDFDCDTKVVYESCHRPDADLKLIVDVPVDPECHVVNICKKD